MLAPGGVAAFADYTLKREPRNVFERFIVEAARRLWKVPRVDVRAHEAHISTCDECRAELARLSSRNEEMRAELGRLAQRNDELQAELTRTSKHNDELQAELGRLPNRNNQRPGTTNPREPGAPPTTPGAPPTVPENDSRVVEMTATGVAPRARARLSYNRRTGVIELTVSDMPPLPAGKTYQLWLLIGGSPVSVGTFNTGPGGHAMLHGQLAADALEASAFAVTLEPSSLPRP